MAIASINDLIIDQLGDLYDAEKQLTRALPKLAKAANDPELAQGFRDHLDQTRTHVARLEKAFESMGKKPRGKTCPAMKGLVEEGAETIEAEIEGSLGDLALIAAARRVEHYESAAYDHLMTLANSVGNTDAATLFGQTFEEEKETDKKLSTIARRLAKATSGEQAMSAAARSVDL